MNSISLDADKGVLTITGTADAVELVEKLRKAKISAEIISFGPEKKEEKKEEEKKEEKEGWKEDWMPAIVLLQSAIKQPSYQYGFPQIVYYE